MNEYQRTIMALCVHAEYTAGCADCVNRSAEMRQYLAQLGAEALGIDREQR